MDSATAFAKTLTFQPLAPPNVCIYIRECDPVGLNSLRPWTDPVPSPPPLFFFGQRPGCSTNQRHPEGLGWGQLSFPLPRPTLGHHSGSLFPPPPCHFWRRPPLGRLLPPVTPMLTEALSGGRGAGWWLLPLRLQCALWLAGWRGAGDDGRWRL